MSKRTVFFVGGVCILVAGLGTGLFVYLSRNKPSEAVSDHVITSSYGSSLTVTNSSATNGYQQASGNQNSASNSSPLISSGGSSGSATSSASKLLDPTTFSQYNTPKYLNGTTAFFADLQAGTGTTLNKAGQKPAILYKGWLTNGTLFDETKTNAQGQNEAFSYTYGANPAQVIAGFDEGMAGMKVGGVRLLIIPPAAGYGATAHNSIPANSVLIFQVQLVAIQ